jgi:hypothetical protein
MAIISYFVAQKYVKIVWQWKIVLLIYAIFLIAVMFSIIDYHFSLPLHTSLLLKFLLTFLSKDILVKKATFLLVNNDRIGCKILIVNYTLTKINSLRPWRTAPNNILDVVLVEPDPVEAKILEKQGQGKVIPYALWSEETE